MIDLSKFVDKKVRVTFGNGQKYKGKFEYCHLLSSVIFPYVFWGEDNTPCNRSGDHYNKNGVNSFAEVFGNSHNITHIEEIKPMIDLSKFVNKDVKVMLRNGTLVEAKILESNVAHKPYRLFDYQSVYSTTYTINGRYYYLNLEDTAWDIIQIEEIKSMNKYEELEKQVAEMQKEIDRLKGEEEKNCLNLKPVEITRTVKITPEEYYEYCKEYKEKPTATGYVKYYSSSAWFMDSGDYTETFKVIGE